MPRYAIVENNHVTNIAEADYPVAENWMPSNDASIGDLFVDGLFVPSELSIEDARSRKIEELKQDYYFVTTQPIEFNGFTWAASKEDQDLLVSVLAVGSVPQGMYWRDLTKTARPMTYSDLQALANAILARSLIKDTNLMNKLQAVDQAETIEAVLAIEW